jgi:hypothetical protein
MSLQYNNLLKADYQAVKAQLHSMGITIAPGIESNAVHSHRLVYSLCLWNHRLKGLPERSRVFLSELASDAIQVMPQALMGYEKTTALLTRGLIEDTLRHLYFTDHPVEFRRDNAVVDWHMSVIDLWDYAFKHPDLIAAEKRWPALARMKGAYSELSQAIHASKVIHHQAKKALADIRCDVAEFPRQIKQLATVTASANYLIAIFQHNKLDSLTASERSIILRTMPLPARAALHDVC